MYADVTIRNYAVPGGQIELSNYCTLGQTPAAASAEGDTREGDTRDRDKEEI